MTSPRPAPHPVTVRLLLAAAAAVFLPGIAGPFVLDDHVNLAPVWAWLQGGQDFVSTLIGNRSGPGGRPLAYLSFMLNAQLGADATFGFKAFNLLLHVVNTWLVYRLARALAMLGPRADATRLALIVAALWALHPSQVSTVSYVVQRMTLLAALAQLAVVLVYLEARTAADPRRERLMLWLAIPALMLAGFFAKETALIAPLLCLVVEFTLLANRPRNLATWGFLAAFVALPALLASAWWLLDPARLQAAYVGREFTLVERLLTEPRIVLEYAWRWLWPAKQALYRDGYPVVTSLTQAAPALALLAAAFVIAFVLRRRAPLVACGLLWFLAGHALEAGPYPLELYFEHRNFLPGFGLALALGAMLPLRWLHGRALAGVGVVLLVLAGLTLLRSFAWSDAASLLEREAPPAPEISRRREVDRAILGATANDPALRADALQRLARGNAGDRAASAAWTAIFACDYDKRVQPAQLAALRDNAPSVITHNHASWLALLAQRAAQSRCEGLARGDMLDILQAWERNTVATPSAYARDRFALMRQQLEKTQ